MTNNAATFLRLSVMSLGAITVFVSSTATRNQVPIPVLSILSTNPRYIYIASTRGQGKASLPQSGRFALNIRAYFCLLKSRWVEVAAPQRKQLQAPLRSNVSREQMIVEVPQGLILGFSHPIPKTTLNEVSLSSIVTKWKFAHIYLRQEEMSVSWFETPSVRR